MWFYISKAAGWSSSKTRIWYFFNSHIRKYKLFREKHCCALLFARMESHEPIYLQGIKTQLLQSLFVGRVGMPVTKLVAYLWNHSRPLISATGFGEQAGILYSRCRRTKAPYKGMKTDFKRSLKERLMMKINRLALFAASDPWLSWIQGWGCQTHRGKNTISGEPLARLWDSCT